MRFAPFRSDRAISRRVNPSSIFADNDSVFLSSRAGAVKHIFQPD